MMIKDSITMIMMEQETWKKSEKIPRTHNGKQYEGRNEKTTPPETMKHGKYMQCTNTRHRNV